MEHVTSSALPASSPHSLSVCIPVILSYLQGPWDATLPSHPLCWGPARTAASFSWVTLPSCRFQLECHILGAFPSTLPGFAAPWLGSRSPLCFPHPGPHPTYCRDLFTHWSSPETANNLKAETVSGSAPGAWCLHGWEQAPESSLHE